jgi:hypothetical protein
MLRVTTLRRGAGVSPYAYHFVRIVGSRAIRIFIASQMCSCAYSTVHFVKANGDSFWGPAQFRCCSQVHRSLTNCLE